jgi:hypothetical protein
MKSKEGSKMKAVDRIPQVVRGDEAYSTAEFCIRAGIGDYVWRRLRHELPVIAVGKKRYVRGCDWLAYLDNQKQGGINGKDRIE